MRTKAERPSSHSQYKKRTCGSESKTEAVPTRSAAPSGQLRKDPLLLSFAGDELALLGRGRTEITLSCDARSTRAGESACPAVVGVPEKNSAIPAAIRPALRALDA